MTIELIRQVPSHYIGEDCLQIYMSIRERGVLISPDGIIYQDLGSSKINRYLDDERKKQFPYSNIPSYVKKVLFQKMQYNLQLLDYNKLYVYLDPYGIFTFQALRNKNEGLVVSQSRPLYTYFSTQPHSLDKKDLEAFLSPQEGKYYYIAKTGKDYELQTKLDDLIDETFNDNQENKTTKLTDTPFLSVQFQDESAVIKQIYVVGNAGTNNELLVYVQHIPIKKHNLETIKNIRTFPSKEPKINLKYNPNITKEDINEAKQLIRTKSPFKR